MKFSKGVFSGLAGLACCTVMMCCAFGQNIVVTSPNGGETWNINTYQKLNWEINSTSVGNLNVEISTDGGSTWALIESNIAYNITGTELEVPATPSTNCRIRVSGADGLNSDVSDSNFTIKNYTGTAMMQLTSFNGGEVWTEGETRTITWTSQGMSTSAYIGIYLSTDAGAHYKYGFAGGYNTGYREATLMGGNEIVSNTCRLQLVDMLGNTIPSDESDNNFTIMPATYTQLTLLYPNGGETFTNTGYSTFLTYWTYLGNVGNINVDISTNALNGPWTRLGTNLSANLATFPLPVTGSPACRIRVSGVSGSISDVSDGNFTINSTITGPHLTLSEWALQFGNIPRGKTKTMTFDITNTGVGVLTGTISSPDSWIIVSPASFSATSNVVTVSVTVDNSILNQSSGTYNGSINIDNNDINSKISVVEFTAIPEGTSVMVVSTSPLSFGEVSVGQKKSLNLHIDNSGEGTLTGAVTVDQEWLTVNPQTFSGNSVDIEISVDLTLELAQYYGRTLNIPAGEYSGNVTVTSNGGTVVIPVTVTATCLLAKPNPVRLSSQDGRATITFFGDGIVSGQTKIIIYTLSGTVVADLSAPDNVTAPMNGQLQNEITWAPSNLSPGIYIYVYNSPKEKGVGKFTVIK